MDREIPKRKKTSTTLELYHANSKHKGKERVIPVVMMKQ